MTEDLAPLRCIKRDIPVPIDMPEEGEGSARLVRIVYTNFVKACTGIFFPDTYNMDQGPAKSDQACYQSGEIQNADDAGKG